MKKILALLFLSLTFFTVGLVCMATPVSAAPKNGVCQATDGNWYYYVDGNIDYSFTDIVFATIDGPRECWFVKNGRVHFEDTIAANEYGSWVIQKGKVNFNFTGFATDGKDYWYAKDGLVDYSAGGIFDGTMDGVKGTWYCVGGKVQFITDIVFGNLKTKDSCWYVVDGKVQYKDTIAKNEYASWVVLNGKVNFDFGGIATDGKDWWYCENGQVQFGASGIYFGDTVKKDSCWYVKSGKVQKNFTGLVQNAYGWWYCENGQIRFDVTDIVFGDIDAPGECWYVKDGKVQFVNTVAPNKYGHWVIKNGKVDFKAKGLFSDGEKTWYCVDGKAQEDITDTIKYGNDWIYIEKGVFDSKLEDIVFGTLLGKKECWYIKDGKVQFVDTIAKNEYGCWVIKDGKVDFTYEGLFKNDYVWWYCEGGMVQFDRTDIVFGYINGIRECWYIEGGKVQFIDTIAKNEYGCWVIRGGKVDFDYDGFFENEYGWWYCLGGKVQFEANGIYHGTVDGEEGYWMVDGGRVIEGDYPTLYQGCAKTVYVGLLQRSLAQLGYVEYVNNGYDDYNYGGGTANGVRAFQKDHGLSVTGTCDAGTWDALMKALNTSNKSEYYDAEFEAYLDEQGFPESYRNALRILHKDHPEWIFVADQINKTFDTELGYQYYHTSTTTVSLIHGTFPDSFKCTDSIAYDASTGTWKTGWDTGNWVIPSKEAIAYYLDPRNFLDECNIFQFLTMDGSISYTEDQIADIAYSLGVSYLGQYYHHTTDDTWINYPDTIKRACEYYGYSPVALISAIKQELGTTSTAVYRDQIRGNVSGYKGLYNYINYDGYAKDGKSAAINALIAADRKGWNKRTTAIWGAAEFFANNYVRAGQETTYYKKFNAKSTLPYANHQFMGSISSAYSEGRNAGLALIDALSDEAVVFKIPVYKNMPTLICQMP